MSNIGAEATAQKGSSPLEPRGRQLFVDFAKQKIVAEKKEIQACSFALHADVDRLFTPADKSAACWAHCTLGARQGKLAL